MDEDWFEKMKMVFVECIYNVETSGTAESERDACAAAIRSIAFKDAMDRLEDVPNDEGE